MNDGQSKRVYLASLGCPKNAVDSEGMAELLLDNGYRLASQPEESDILIVNTCGFLESARQEATELLLELAADKRPGQTLIAAGCLPQRIGRDMLAEVPDLDGLIGARSWPDIFTFLRSVAGRSRREPLIHLPDTGMVPVEQVALKRVAREQSASAYLKIGDGCSAGCAFCTIPSIKGPARSRSPEIVLQEARVLVDQGVKEIILIAQDTTAYGRDLSPPEGDGLPGLIDAVLEAVPEPSWLRLMYAYPGQLDRRLIDVMATQAQMCHYLDLPLQHGHPDTLRRMRRPHRIDSLLEWIDALRAAVPDVALRTTFIVGFPGETEAEFQSLLDFMAEVEFDRVGVFPYSREPGTPAFDMPDQVAEEVKDDRFERAMEIQQAISLRKNQSLVGRRLDVLVEGSDSGISVGRSYRDAPEIDGYVLIEGEWPVNEFLPVTVTGASEYDIMAKPVREGRRDKKSRRGRRRAAGRGRR
jgi:ribosomal protein S12 methylthiotransferase